MKAQLIVDLESHKILSTCAGQGRTHDYKLYQNSDTKIADNTEIHVDLGYLGIQKVHPTVKIPNKKTKNKPLTPEQKKENRLMAKIRVAIEHVNRRIKVFRIFSETYRNRRSRFSLRLNLIAALYNIEYGI